MEDADYGKMVKYMLNNNYDQSVIAELNKVFKNGKASIEAVNMLKAMPPAQDLYSFLPNIGGIRDDAVTKDVFNKNIYDAFTKAGGMTFHLNSVKGGYRKNKTAKKTYRKNTKKVYRKASKKTRKY